MGNSPASRLSAVGLPVVAPAAAADAAHMLSKASISSASEIVAASPRATIALAMVRSSCGDTSSSTESNANESSEATEYGVEAAGEPTVTFELGVVVAV
eukprot:CAMPEP_0174719750 /NCGR_PEP_ID=MMETSP1094-20130205/31884_1 /TAXON_ID=156173 /ORGANISM="Chrysochromulina brevifilum, Strain UTEX LB 985" /LENGTH=98 /DNA_ID=CAMNT_0015920109 /DNA_START=524 /DNA_END=820 /DNA_ORIENTATION=-